MQHLRKNNHMKKILALIIISFISNNVKSQCLITLEQLELSNNLTSSQFDAFAVNNGFSFNPNRDEYLCNIPLKTGGHVMLLRSLTKKGDNLVTYIFSDKEQFLFNKNTLEAQGELIETNNNTSTINYLYHQSLVSLTTVKFKKNTTYYLLISNK